MAGCSYTHLPTVVKLATNSPLNADPAHYLVAVTLSDGIGIQKNSAVLTFQYEDTLSGEADKGEFILNETRNSGVIQYKIAQQDLDEIRDLRRRARLAEERSPKTSSGSVGFTLSGCITGDEIPLDATFSTAISYAEDGNLLPLLKNTPITAILDIEDLENADADQIPRCAN